MKILRMWKRLLGILLVLVGHSGVLVAELITTAPGGTPTGGYQATSEAMVDLIRGHVMFKEGFSIAGGSTATWDADGIVNGPITFGDGSSTLALSTDLRLGTTGTLVRTSPSAIKISGNGNSLILGGNVTLDASETSAREITVATDLTIDGQGKTLTLRNSTYFAPASGKILTLKNMTLVYEERTGNSCCFQGSGSYILENVTIRALKFESIVANLFKTTGAQNVTIRGRVVIDVPNVRVNLTNGAVPGMATVVTIEKNSTLYIGKGTQLHLGNTWGITFTMTDKTSVLHLDGCDFYTGTDSTSLLTLTKGTVLFENKVRIFNISYDTITVNTDMAKALTFGDGGATNDVDVRVLGGAYVIVQGCMKYNPV